MVEEIIEGIIELMLVGLLFEPLVVVLVSRLSNQCTSEILEILLLL